MKAFLRGAGSFLQVLRAPVLLAVGIWKHELACVNSLLDCKPLPALSICIAFAFLHALTSAM